MEADVSTPTKDYIDDQQNHDTKAACKQPTNLNTTASRNKQSKTVTKKKSRNIRNTPTTSQAKSHKSEPEQAPASEY